MPTPAERGRFYTSSSYLMHEQVFSLANPTRPDTDCSQTGDESLNGYLIINHNCFT